MKHKILASWLILIGYSEIICHVWTFYDARERVAKGKTYDDFGIL